MTCKKSWISVDELFGRNAGDLFKLIFEEDDVTPKINTKNLRVGRPRPQPADVGQAVPAPEAPKVERPKQWNAIPAMGEIGHSEASLASRARPDLPSASDRHTSFTSSYHDKDAVNKTLHHIKGSSNVVFHGTLNNGAKYISKPHEGVAHQPRFDPGEELDTAGKPQPREPLGAASFKILKDELPDAAKRHDATYSIMAAMGAHHMVTPGMQTNVHARHQISGSDPQESDSEAKRLTMPTYHAGSPTHVQQFIDDAKTVRASSKEELNNVDLDHRLHGLVAHVLFGNGDGHANNVMIHKSGHPVLIDHDITLGSAQARGYKEHFGKEAVRSVFTPGGRLDYQAKLDKDESGNMIPIGSNFPPRMKETLQRIADGYFSDKGEGNLSLSDDDNRELQRNASALLRHGLEGTLERRHDMDAEFNAKRLAAEGKPVKNKDDV